MDWNSLFPDCFLLNHYFVGISGVDNYLLIEESIVDLRYLNLYLDQKEDDQIKIYFSIREKIFFYKKI